MERKEKEDIEKSEREKIASITEIGSDSEPEVSEFDEDSTIVSDLKRKRMTKSEIKSYKNVMETAERFGLSDTATAHMVNVCVATLGNNNSNENILYQSKVNDIKKKFRLEKIEESKGKCPIAIGIDERKDNAKVQVGIGEKGTKRLENKKIENCAVVYWPGPEYVGHIQTTSGRGH